MRHILLSIVTVLSFSVHADPSFDYMANEFQNLQQVESSFQTVSDHLIAQKDPRGAFVRVYAVVTRNISAMLAAGQFENPAWVETVGITYANFFRRSFFSYDVYKKSGSWTSHLSQPWQLAFQENTSAQLALPVQLILSVNAHIQGDLPEALIESGADFSEACHRDYQRIGEVFARSFNDSWQAVLLIDQKPRADIIEAVGTWMAQNWIKIFREGAWKNGLKLYRASNRETVLRKIEADAYRSGLGFRTLNFWTN